MFVRANRKISESEGRRRGRQRAMSIARFSEDYAIGRTKVYEELKFGATARPKNREANDDQRRRCRGLASVSASQGFGEDHDMTETKSPSASQASIRATLIGSNRCEAEGISARGYAPVLDLCRELVAAGYQSGLLRSKPGAARHFVCAFARLVRAHGSPSRTTGTAPHAFDAAKSAR